MVPRVRRVNESARAPGNPQGHCHVLQVTTKTLFRLAEHSPSRKAIRERERERERSWLH